MQLAIFKYEDNEDDMLDDLTTIEIDGEPWFVASEICNLLDIKKSRDAVSELDEDEKALAPLPTAGGVQNSYIVNESGLYSLIFRSVKPGAKKFRKWVTRVVIPSIRKTGSFGTRTPALPAFVARYNANWDRVERGYFSVISELFVRVYGRFEQIGYHIPDKALETNAEIRPDISVGLGFAKYLREHHPEHAANFKEYSHILPNGIIIPARQYPNAILPLFIEYVDNQWLPNSAPKYLGDRDRTALDYLPKLLA